MRYVRRRGDRPPPLDVDALADCLEAYPIELGVLFGSHATGTAHALSDLDVAVVFREGFEPARKRELLDEMTAAITRATGFEAVDLVDLAETPPGVAHAALSDGRLVIGDETTAVALEAEFLVRKLDFQPVRDAWYAALDERIETGGYGRC